MSEEGQAIEQPRSFDENVAAARAILDREDAPETPPQEAQTPEPQEAQPPEPVAEEPPAQEIQIDPDVPLFDVEEVKEGGVKEKVKRSLNELIKERMLHADYTRKTQELAKQRQSLPEEAKKLVEPQLKTAEQTIQLANQLIQELVAPELVGLTPQKMAELSQSDPAQFAALLGKQQLVASHVQRIAAQQQQIQAYKSQERLQELAKAANESREVLQSEIPNWSAETYETLLNTGAEYGLKPAELGRVQSVDQLQPLYATDHRLIKILHDAHKYRELQKAKPEIEKRVTVAPKVIKPGVTETKDAKTDAREKAFAKLKKSGSTDDAIAFAKHLV